MMSDREVTIQQQRERCEQLRNDFIDLYNCMHAGNHVPDRLHNAYRNAVGAIIAGFPVEAIDE